MAQEDKKWEGITTPQANFGTFIHRGNKYVFGNLTRQQIEKLADDPKFRGFSRVETEKKAAAKPASTSEKTGS